MMTHTLTKREPVRTGVNNKLNYFYMDFTRGFKSLWFALAVMGVFLTWLLSYREAYEKATLDSVWNVWNGCMLGGSGFFSLNLIFCAVPYATGFCEDLEMKYLQYLAIRGSLKHYVWSKILIIFGTAVGAMTVGTTIFALILRMQFPWVNVQTLSENILGAGGMFLIEKEFYFPWFVLYGLQWGLWFGVLALSAAYLSIYIRNRLLTWTIPVLLNQLLAETNIFGLGDIPHFNLTRNFDLMFPVLGGSVSAFLWNILVSVFLSCVLGIGIYRKLRRSL